MKHFDGSAVATALPYRALVAAIEAAFRDDVTTPLRQHYDIEVPHGTDGAMLVMPAWRSFGRALSITELSTG